MAKKTARTVFGLGLAAALAAVLGGGPATATTVPSGTKAYVPLDEGSVAVIDAVTMTLLTTIPVHEEPRGCDATPDGAFVYVANSIGAPIVGVANTPTVSVIDTATDTVVKAVALTRFGPYDCAVTPDGSRVYVACSDSAEVVVIDTATNEQTLAIPLATPFGDPESLAVSPDGTKVYVANRSGGNIEAIDTTTNTLVGQPLAVTGAPRDVAFNASGTRAIVVSDGPAEIIDVANFTLLTTDFQDVGSNRHVTVVGDTAYVTNLNFQPPLQAGKTPPEPGGPSLDLYDLAALQYVESYQPGVSQPYGIEASSDGACLFVTSKNDGFLGTVDRASGDSGDDAVATGGTSRGVAIVTPSAEEVPVVSYFLPRSLNVKAGTAGKESIGASGLYDDGGATVDYTQPVTVEIGGFSRTMTLVPKRKSFKSPKGEPLKFQITPNLKGSSRGKFKLKLAKATLGGAVPTTGELPLHFRAAGMPDAEGTIKLTNGRYRLGKARGALVSPPFYPQRAKATLKPGAADKLALRGGFASDGVTPGALGSVRLGFGAFTRTISGSAFTKKGDSFKFAETVGATKLKVTVDFLRELVTVSAKGIELGDLSTATVDIAFADGSGVSVRCTVKLGGTGTKRAY